MPESLDAVLRDLANPTGASQTAPPPIRRTPARHRLLLVDDEPHIREVLRRALHGGPYEIAEAADGEAALRILRTEGADLVLSDLLMPRVDGIELLSEAKKLDPTIGFILLTGVGTVENAVEALRLQADDYLLKPFNLDEVRLSVGRALEHRRLVLENSAYQTELEERVREQAQQIERLFVDALLVLANAVEARDGYTGGHVERVTRYAVTIGHQMGLERERLRYLWVGGLLHDIGKLAIPDEILNKPGRLTNEEYEVMKRHPSIGAAILERSSFLQPALPGVLHHHEHWDGNGYPLGLKGEEISLEGRILTVADTFDAIITTRPYRPKRSLEEAVRELRRCAGAQFDQTVVETFIAALEEGLVPKDDVAPLSAVPRE